MNKTVPSVESNNTTPTETQAVSPAPPHHNPLANVISRMNITQMTLVVVLALFLWQWFDGHHQLNSMQQEVAHRLTEMEGNNKATQVLVAHQQESTRELTAKMALLEAHYAKSQNQRAALELLYQELSSSRDETTMAQVEQMLMIAGQQLQLSANVKAALIAMQQADDYLKRMNRPLLTRLSKAISLDMSKLRELPNVDTANINLHLDNLIAVVDSLPLSQDVRPPPQANNKTAATTDDSVWLRLAHEVWDDAKHLVRIENTKKHELPLLSPTETFFLRENLKLRLLSARLALLSRDETSYKHDLLSAQQWIMRYFNTKSDSSKQAISILKKLSASGINIQMPDISASLEAVRHFRATHEKPAQ